MLTRILLLLLAAKVVFAGGEWTIEEYPNPQKNPKLCNVKSVAYVCDPDEVLKSTEVKEINETIRRSFDRTSYKCPYAKDKTGYRIGVALLKKLSGANSESISGLSQEQKSLHLAKQFQELVEFSDSLREKWNFGDCDNDLIIIYLKSSNTYYTSVGRAAARILSEELVYDVFTDMGHSTSRLNRIDRMISDYTSIFNREYIRKRKSQGKPNIQSSTKLDKDNEASVSGGIYHVISFSLSFICILFYYL